MATKPKLNPYLKTIEKKKIDFFEPRLKKLDRIKSKMNDTNPTPHDVAKFASVPDLRRLAQHPDLQTRLAAWVELHARGEKLPQFGLTPKGHIINSQIREKDALIKFLKTTGEADAREKESRRQVKKLLEEMQREEERRRRVREYLDSITKRRSSEILDSLKQNLYRTPRGSELLRRIPIREGELRISDLKANGPTDRPPKKPTGKG